MSRDSQYFENEKHPSSTETLSTATSTASIPRSESKTVMEEGFRVYNTSKMLIRDQAGNGVDSAPYIVVEGKRRDITSPGAKEVGEYIIKARYQGELRK